MSDMAERLRNARNWLNRGKCCGDKDSDGVCAAPACIFGEALKELYKAADKIESLSTENARLREALLGATAALTAAISLLERSPSSKKSAPSDKMFEMMLSDYHRYVEQARAALEQSKPKP